jgi:hypothetical protein
MANALAALALVVCCILPIDAYAAQTAVRPLWSDLTAAQRKVLAPLEPEWNRFPADQRKRWIALADRFPKLTPAEQKRVQERMRDWAKLTPQQRDTARARYRALSKLTPEQRRAIIKQWTDSQEAQQAESNPAAPEPSAESGSEGARPEESAIPPAERPAATP